jgi:hypothetical protein
MLNLRSPLNTCMIAHDGARTDMPKSARAGIEVETVGSLDQLAAVVQKVFATSKSRWWFRGQIDSTWKLVPKVWRSYDALRERYLANLFYQRAKLRHASFPDDKDYAAWLALMQHYGLPTRLLDWSDSALIAAYFAVKYERDMSRTAQSCDAAIWMLQPETLNAAQGMARYFLRLMQDRSSQWSMPHSRRAVVPR